MYYLGIIGGEGGEGGERNPFDCGWEGGGEKAMPLGEDVRILMRFYYAHGYWRKMVTSIGGLKTVFNNSYTFFLRRTSTNCFHPRHTGGYSNSEVDLAAKEREEKRQL